MNKKVLYQSMLAIAVPIALQNLITVAVQMADTIMLGSLGEIELSASSLANQLFFIFTLAMYGTAGGANVLVAQFWGKKDSASIRHILSYTYWVVFAVSLLMILLSLFVPGFIMSLFTSDPAVIEQGVSYLRIVCISYLFFGLTTITGNILRGVQSVRISLWASIVSLVVNVFFNWVFIFGYLGAPAMGVAGAAVATTIARIVECAILLVYIGWYDQKIRYRFSCLLHPDRKLRSSFVRNCTPVIGNELLWSMGFTMVTVVIGRMGTSVVAANSIYNVVTQLVSVMGKGLSSAAAVLVGNAIGARRQKDLPFIVSSLQKTAGAAGLISMVFVWAVMPLMPLFYNISETTMNNLFQIMASGAVLQAFMPLSFVNMVGILRGGGDAKFVFVNDIAYMWIFCIPLGYLTGVLLHWPVWLVFVILRFDDIIKVLVSHYRIKSGKWIYDVT